MGSEISGKTPIKVLIVDDTSETRESLRKLLSFHGGFVVTGEAENGKEAVALAKRLKPDVVLMDINMPVMDGIEATRMISVEMPMGTAVVIISVQGEQEYLREAMAAGARLSGQAFSADELVSTIRRTHDMEVARRAHQCRIPFRKLGRSYRFTAPRGRRKDGNCRNPLLNSGNSDSKVVLVDRSNSEMSHHAGYISCEDYSDIAREEEVD